MSPASVDTRPPLTIAQLPGPKPWPLAGNLMQLDLPRLHEQCEAWAREYGPLYRLRLGRKNVIALADPELIAVVLRARPDIWRRMSNFEPLFREYGAHGLFSAEGDDWRRQRRLVMSAFDPAHLRRYMPSLVRVTARLLGRWRQAAREQEVLDLKTQLMRYSVDVTAGLAFGVDMNTVEQERSELHEHLDVLFPMLYRRVNMPFPYWRYVRLPIDRRFDRHVLEIHREIRHLVALARRRISDPERRMHPTDLLEAMLAARDADGDALSEEEVIGNVFTVLGAGEDTTANSLAWAIYLLHAHPVAWRRVVEEVDAVLAGEGMPTSPDQARELQFVDACINEAMRLKPVAPLLFLDAAQATRIGNLEVPQGTTLFCLMRPGAIDVLRLKDANRFEPERWLAGAQAPLQSPKRTSMPFGAGPRLCPGRYLAMLEMTMALSMLARNFELRRVGTADGAPPAERLTFTMHPAGLQLCLAERDKRKSG